MATNYQKLFQKDYEKLVFEVEKLTNLIKEQNNIIKDLNATVNNMSNLLASKDEENKKLILEIQRLKNNNNKDSTNSGKPSSKNEFKKIKNSREKTIRKKGGQKGHKGSTTSISKVRQLIDSGNVKHDIIDIDKTIENKDKPYISRYVQDIEITTVVKEYRYYPDKFGEYNIPKSQNNVVTYGNELKSISMLLVHI